LASVLSRIQSIQNLPKEVDPTRLDSITCASLDLSSAILKYVVVALHHLKGSFTSAIPSSIHYVDVENLLRNIFIGSKSFKEAIADLETATKVFNASLNDFALSLMSVSYRAIIKNDASLELLVEQARVNSLATKDLSAAIQLDFESSR
jgi:hypothetical protein